MKKHDIKIGDRFGRLCVVQNGTFLARLNSGCVGENLLRPVNKAKSHRSK